jgi:hypothetical protein
MERTIDEERTSFQCDSEVRTSFLPSSAVREVFAEHDLDAEALLRLVDRQVVAKVPQHAKRAPDEVSDVLGDDGVDLAVDQRLPRRGGEFMRDDDEPVAARAGPQSLEKRRVARAHRIDADQPVAPRDHLGDDVRHAGRIVMGFHRRQHGDRREVARHDLVEAKPPLDTVPRPEGVGDHKDLPAPRTKRPIRLPAVRPAAMLLIPMKKSRREFGRSDTSVTTATPASLSREIASRTWGVSGTMSAIPSSPPALGLKRPDDGVRVSIGTRITLTTVLSAICEA